MSMDGPEWNGMRVWSRVLVWGSAGSLEFGWESKLFIMMVHVPCEELDCTENGFCDLGWSGEVGEASDRCVKLGLIANGFVSRFSAHCKL